MQTETSLEQPRFTDQELFKKIWTSPRLVFSYIHSTNYRKYFYLLAVLAGISNAFDRAALKDLGDTYSLPLIMGLSIVLGGLLGWISIYIYSFLISLTGGWLGGKSTTSSIFHIVVYAMIPSVLALTLVIIQIGFFGNQVFQSNLDFLDGGILGNIVFWITTLAELGLAIYTLVFLTVANSEVQGLSTGKSILNLLLPILVIIIPIILLVLIVSALSGL